MAELGVLIPMLPSRSYTAYPQSARRAIAPPRVGVGFGARECAWMLLLGLLLFMQVWAFSTATDVSKNISQLRSSIAMREMRRQNVEVLIGQAQNIDRISSAATNMGMVKAGNEEIINVNLPHIQ